MEEDLIHVKAVIEPNSNKIFEAHIEEYPEIKCEGEKIKDILEVLNQKLENKFCVDRKFIKLSISIRVRLDF